MLRIVLPMPAALMSDIDKVRGDVPRTVWIRRAIDERLERDHTRQPKAAA
jgi:hypothetical protein